MRLFRLAGINVYLHWSWFVFAVFEINMRSRDYSSVVWNVLEYLALFLIVLTHEFGHALACRQVGGNANQIVLWPLGGVAYVDPPPRPGATLWTIAAGPLVNVALLPILGALFWFSRASGWRQTNPNLASLVLAVLVIDAILLAFNILPIYPLDGGQMLRSLLWFFMGRARSLMVATVLGFVGVAAMIFYALRTGSLWFGVLSVFILLNCWGGMKQALALLRMAKLPRHQGFACPWCKAGPPIGNFWRCGSCGAVFDTFQTGGKCPQCGISAPITQCLDCGRRHPMNEWVARDYVNARL